MGKKIRMILSKDQEKALAGLMDWWKEQRGWISLGGYAGTGKTTLIASLRERITKEVKINFCAYTGKAARVLGEKLRGYLGEEDFVGTIHSLIYSPIINDKEEIVGWERKKEVEGDLIVIDEASMVDGEIWKDLLSYGLPIVAVGDHGQLPPIRGNFNLMEKPDLVLDKIHRQAENDPIIKMSVWARKTGKVPVGRYGPLARKIRAREDGEEVEELLRGWNPSWMVLCGFNNSRVRLNDFIRRSRGIDGREPIVGERVICLRNNWSKDIFNGMMGVVEGINKENENWYRAEIAMDDLGQYEGLILREQFGQNQTMSFGDGRYKTIEGDLFDFGYALTVHKAQGSQSRKVLLFEERFGKMSDEEWRRWLYTGITRAEEELVVVGR